MLINAKDKQNNVWVEYEETPNMSKGGKRGYL